MKWKIAISPIKAPCLGCKEKIPPTDFSNGCRPTCKKYADFRSALGEESKKRMQNAEIANMEFDRIHGRKK